MYQMRQMCGQLGQNLGVIMRNLVAISLLSAMVTACGPGSQQAIQSR